MAKEEYSLSWFKKRTQEVNARTGSKLSPTALYKAQKTSPTARAWIAETREREEAAAAVGRRRVLEPPRYEKLAFERELKIWEAFAGANRYANNVLESYKKGGFTNEAGTRLYEQFAGQWFSIDPTRPPGKNMVPLKSAPVGAVPLDPKKLNDVLGAAAKKAKEYVAAKPTMNYARVNPKTVIKGEA